MSRTELFKSLSGSPMYQGAYKKLRKAEIAECLEFIAEHDSLEYGPFNKALSTWYLGRPDKPKNIETMYALVMAANPLPADWRERRGR